MMTVFNALVYFVVRVALVRRALATHRPRVRRPCWRPDEDVRSWIKAPELADSPGGDEGVQWPHWHLRLASRGRSCHGVVRIW